VPVITGTKTDKALLFLCAERIRKVSMYVKENLGKEIPGKSS
jgi:hypothetical protein